MIEEDVRGNLGDLERKQQEVFNFFLNDLLCQLLVFLFVSVYWVPQFTRRRAHIHLIYLWKLRCKSIGFLYILTDQSILV